MPAEDSKQKFDHIKVVRRVRVLDVDAELGGGIAVCELVGVVTDDEDEPQLDEEFPEIAPPPSAVAEEDSVQLSERLRKPIKRRGAGHPSSGGMPAKWYGGFGFSMSTPNWVAASRSASSSVFKAEV
jgi:hypothetical protein